MDIVFPGHDPSSLNSSGARPASPHTLVRSSPARCEVYVDGQLVGTTPLRYRFFFPRVVRAVWSETSPSPQSPGRPVSALESECDLRELKPDVASSPASIAVLDFHDASGSAGSAGVPLADICRGVVQQTGCFILLERSDMKAILSEEDFAYSIACDDTKCLVDYGKKLQAQNIIHGRISRIGHTYVLTIKMLDTSSARILSIQTATAGEDLESLLAYVEPLTCELLRKGLSQ